MKVKTKKLSVLLVMVLIVSLCLGLTVNAATEAIHLAFTSDAHYSTTNTGNNLDVWMHNLKKEIDHLDYMGFCGDLGSAYAPTPADYWEYAGALMDTADSYVESGFITKGTIFAFGNHEWYPSAGGDYANNKDNANAKRLFGPVGEAAKTDDYIIYAFGATSANEVFEESDIDTLNAYLDAAPKDIPIIILSHFPLHGFGSRATGNAAVLIDMLNAYPNVIFLWGHNHTNSDTMYDNICTDGDAIKPTKLSGDMDISFTYCAAGCMSDSEYGAGSAFVKGKGLVITLEGGKVSLKYYTIDGDTLDAAKTIDMSALGAEEPALPPVEENYRVSRSSQTIKVNGVEKVMDAYLINGSNYFKLRDIACVLDGTKARFSVSYDSDKRVITCVSGETYVPDGSELVIGEDKSASAKPSSQSLMINGQSADLTAFFIGGNNYFKLCDLGTALGFTVDFDEATRTVLITSPLE